MGIGKTGRGAEAGDFLVKPGPGDTASNSFFLFFFPGLDVMPFPTTPSTRGKRVGQELKSGTSKSP